MTDSQIMLLFARLGLFLAIPLLITCTATSDQTRCDSKESGVSEFMWPDIDNQFKKNCHLYIWDDALSQNNLGPVAVNTFVLDEEYFTEDLIDSNIPLTLVLASGTLWSDSDTNAEYNARFQCSVIASYRSDKSLDLIWLLSRMDHSGNILWSSATVYFNAQYGAEYVTVAGDTQDKQRNVTFNLVSRRKRG